MRVLALLLLAASAFAADVNPSATDVRRFYSTMLTNQAQMDAQNDLSSSVVFVGDSITQRFDVGQVVARSANFGIGGDTTRGLCDRITSLRAVRTAKSVVVHIGANDADLTNILTVPGDVAPHAQCIANAITVPFVWAAIHHRWPSGDPTTYTSIELQRINERVDLFNAAERSACSWHPNCVWLPSNIDDNPTNFVDGLHPNARGYATWASAIRGAIYQ